MFQFHLATTTGAGVSMMWAASVPSSASSWQILHNFNLNYQNVKNYHCVMLPNIYNLKDR